MTVISSTGVVTALLSDSATDSKIDRNLVSILNNWNNYPECF